MAAALERHFGDGIETTVEPGLRGMFDVKVDGEMIFSKYEEHRFPDDAEIIATLASRG